MTPALLPALARSCDKASMPCKVRRTRGNLPRSCKQTLLRDQVEGALVAIGKQVALDSTTHAASSTA